MKLNLSKIIIYSFFLIVAIAILTTIALLIFEPISGLKIVKDHLRHYIIGLIISAILIVIFWKKFDWEQRIIYLVIPITIASGWPDLIYFVSYIFQHGTIKGVLINKNVVYTIMHKYLSTMSAGPIITGTLLLYDNKFTKRKNKYWYWTIIVLVSTIIASFMHVFLDRKFGF